ncbi:MAG: alpha/beta hydrolase [Pseudomonadales bacterium]|nr:alpha/beta hydrolase [Pseudomonadales bacterium]
MEQQLNPDTSPVTGVETVRRPTSHIYYSQRLRLHYLNWAGGGTENGGPNLLLIHGVQDHCHTWDGYAGAFAGEFQIVVPDLRGHGDSEWLRGAAYQTFDYVYDIAQLVRQRDLGPCVVVGHSMGGTIAALYAGLYPELVSRLVLIEGVGLWPDPAENLSPQQRLRGWIDGTRQLAGRERKRYPTLEAALARMQAANAHLSDDQARHLTVHGTNQNEDGTFSWKFDNYTHGPSAIRPSRELTKSLWQAIDCPVLCINSRQGFGHRIGQNGTLAHFRNGEVIDIDSAGHWTHHDQLDQVVAESRRFFAE